VVLHRYAVELPIVLNKSEVTSLLFDKEDGRGHWRLGRNDVTFL
jgi:hypothetical protein